jgi:hypothetical protein
MPRFFGSRRNLKRRQVKFLHDYSLSGMGTDSVTISLKLALTTRSRSQFPIYGVIFTAVTVARLRVYNVKSYEDR